jgi:predicted RNA-binding Zn ribbon-like protein
VASVLVDGLRLPLRVAGDPALDFCNTRAGWTQATPKEYLVSYRHLAGWARWADLVDGPVTRRALAAAGADPAGAQAVTGRAIALRQALYGVLVVDGPGQLSARPASDAPAWALLGSQAASAAAALALVPSGAGGIGGLAGWEPAPDCDPMLAPYLAVVRAVTALLTSPASRSVRACPMPDCGWVFADATGRRRWCSMSLCGNRAKARRHAARTRPATGAAAGPSGR